MTDRHVLVVDFVPGVTVRIPDDDPLPIKGVRITAPAHVHFAQVYDAVPVVTFDASMRALDAAFPRTRVAPSVVFRSLNAHLTSALPPPRSVAQPVPPCAWVEALDAPYRISAGVPAKIADSLQWISTNLAIWSRQVAEAPDTEQLFRTFGLILKSDGYRLARAVTPNASMALQSFLLESVAPSIRDRWKRGSVAANQAALRVLAASRAPTTLEAACELATFAGTTWFGTLPLGPGTAPAPSGGLLSVARGLARWGRDDRPRFLAAVAGARMLAVVLDDCGEAVFDLDLIRLLMQTHRDLAVTLLARGSPDGRNVTAKDVLDLITVEPFASLARAHAAGRLRVLTVNQPFPSFEPVLLPVRIAALLQTADVVLVKGAGFFETLLLDRDVYYTFVVFGGSSMVLTGLERGQGIFQWVPSGSSPYDLGRVLGVADGGVTR